MIRILPFLILLPLYIQAIPIEPLGSIESSITYNLDSLNENGSSIIHQERLTLGIKGSHQSFWNMNYQMTIGGVMLGNSGFPITQLTPEYGLHSRLKPTAKMELALFSYSRLRNPMQVFSDSLEYQEFVHGLRLATQYSANTRFSLATGIRSQNINHRESFSSSQQFVQLRVDQRIAGMQVQFAGESDIWGRDSSDNKQLNTASVRWSGSPIKALNWTGVNALYLADDYNFWRISHRLNYDISRDHSMWMHYNLGDFAYGSQDLIRQNYDFRYRYQWKPQLELALVFEGNKVSIPDSVDIFHWRSYGLSAGWSGGRKTFFRGNVDLGFKESFRFGKGLDFQLNASENVQLLNSRIMTIQLRDDLYSELFQRFDESGDLQYDVQHKIRFTTNFLPGSRNQFGNHFKIHSHFGSDLDFSPDTLRNAVIDEIYYKIFRQNSQFSVAYNTILEMEDPENDLQFRINTRFYRRISRQLSTNFMTIYRFQSEQYQDYIWLSGALKYHTSLFNCALEIQSAGHPDIAFKQDSRIWFRFVRKI